MSVSQYLSERAYKAPPTPLAGWFTLERGLYALWLLLAAGLRLGGLAVQPLNAAEAGQAWSAWLVANGHAAALAPAPTSPLLYSLYTLLFWAGGATDATARFVPALCGIGAVFLLWYWRAWVGRLPTLFAGLLFAVDPWLVAHSRLAESTMLSLFLAMLTLTGLLQIAAQEDNHEPATPESAIPPLSPWQTTTAISFGLLLVSGPQSWGWLVLLALFCWLCLSVAQRQAWLQQPTLLLLVVGAALIGATGWLARPEGLSAISTSLTTWITQITGADARESYSLGWVAWRFLIEQPFVLFFGVIGLGAYWRNSLSRSPAYQPAWLRFVVAWLLWGLLLLFLPGRTPFVLIMVSLPLLFLAAYGVQQLLQEAQEGVAWRENALFLSVLAILLISFAFWLAALTNNATFDGMLARTLLIILVLIFLLTLAYTLWLDGRQARLTTGALLATILLAWTISSSWQLNQRFDLAYPDGFFATYTNPDVRRLVADVEMLSAQRKGDPGELPVQVEMAYHDGAQPDPVLGWYLRNMRNLAWVLAPGIVDGQSPPVVITISDASLNNEGDSEAEDSAVNQLAASYLGSRYALRDYWLPTALTADELPAAVPIEGAGFGSRVQEQLNQWWVARGRALLRWLIYREAPAIPSSDMMVLWVMAGENP